MNPEEIPYRSAAPVDIESSKESFQDEADFSTLKLTLATLRKALKDQSEDFDAFRVLESADERESAKDLLMQIKVKKAVANILIPIISAIESSINNINK